MPALERRHVSLTLQDSHSIPGNFHDRSMSMLVIVHVMTCFLCLPSAHVSADHEGLADYLCTNESTDLCTRTGAPEFNILILLRGIWRELGMCFRPQGSVGGTEAYPAGEVLAHHLHTELNIQFPRSVSSTADALDSWILHGI